MYCVSQDAIAAALVGNNLLKSMMLKTNDTEVINAIEQNMK